MIALVGEKVTGHYRFNKGFYGLADMPVIFQDDIIIVTRGSTEEHYEEVTEVLNIVEENGYRASLEKSKFFQKSATWCGFDIDENGIRPKNNRVEAVLKIEPPRTLKEARSFLGAVQYLAKFIPNLSEKTQPIRELLKKTQSGTGMNTISTLLME